MAYLHTRIRKGLVWPVVRDGLLSLLSLAAFFYWGWLVGDSLDFRDEHSNGLLRVLVNVGVFIVIIVLLVGFLRRLYGSVVAMLHPDLYKLSSGFGDVSMYVAKIEHATTSLDQVRNLEAFEDCLVGVMDGRLVIFPWSGLKVVSFRESTGENEEGGLEVILSGSGGLNASVMVLNIYDYSTMKALLKLFKSYAPGIKFKLDQLAKERFELAGIEMGRGRD